MICNCKKKNNTLSWDANYIAPISLDTLNFSELFGLNNLTITNNGNHAVYNDTLELFKLNQEDFLPELDFSWTDTLEIPDEIEYQGVTFNTYGIPFPPGFEIPIYFPSSENFTFEDLRLASIRFNNLKLKYTVNTNFNGAVDFNLVIPSLTNIYGEEFNTTVTVPNANGQMNTFNGELLLEEHFFDLTNNDSTYNNINTLLRIGCSSENNSNITLDSNSHLSFTLSLTDLNINSIDGYLGNLNFSDTSQLSIPFMKKLSSDNIAIEDPEIELILKNGLGIDGQIVIDEIEFEKNQSSLYMQHDLIGQNFNISRALDLVSDFNYSTTSILINNQNSNLEELIGLFPENINLTYQLQTNPLGNISGYNDFYKNPHTLSTLIGLKIPLKLNFNNLKYCDTINFSFPESIRPNNGKLIFEITNEFPFSFCIHLNVPNGDSIIIEPNCINPSIVDDFGNLIDAQTTQMEIPLNRDMLNQIIDQKNILFNLIVNSPDSLINYPITSQQCIYYKIGIDLNTTVSLK